MNDVRFNDKFRVPLQPTVVTHRPGCGDDRNLRPVSGGVSDGRVPIMKDMSSMSPVNAGKISAPEHWETVNRVVFPMADQDLTMPLYAIEWTRPHLTDQVFDPRVDKRRIDLTNMNKSGFQRLMNESVTARPQTNGGDVFSVDSRRSITVYPGRHISLCTFFNAFPAGYWRRWTRVDAVRFTALARGKGSVTLFRSTGRGLFSPVSTVEVDSPDRATTVAVTIPMTGLVDGGYFWFDAQAGPHDELTVEDAEWDVPRSARTATRDGDTTLSITITTFNRAPYCHNQLKAIAADTDLRMRLDTIYCVDQGTDLVQDQPGFADTARTLGKQLTYLRQANLGGSGGYSRGMYETLQAGSSDYVQLLDDDAISEPEAILRAVQFADYTRKPTIVGGGMLHLDNRTILYTQGERFNRRTWWYGNTMDLEYNHDFAASPLRDSPERHRRIDTDFNGWWMCLIPVAIIREIGLALPVFIKFDDTEYSLRAREHGYPTVCLPGVAVWHQAWHDKDPARTWEEYFFQRNRWICALLHARKPSRRFMFEMLYGDVNVGLKLIYSALKLRHMGLRDIMRGPAYIVDSMPGKLAEVRKAREGFADSTDITDLETLPEPRYDSRPAPQPQNPKDITRDGVRAVLKALLSRRDGTKDKQPDTVITAKDAVLWDSFTGVGSALVTAPDGNSVAWRRRNPKLFRKGLREGVMLARRMMRNWSRLSEEYRAYDMASVKVWERIFKNVSGR